MDINDLEPKQINSISKVVAYFVFAGMGAIALHTFGDVAESVKKMEQNIAELNQKMAIVVVKTGDHTERLKDHEDRIRDLELKKK